MKFLISQRGLNIAMLIVSLALVGCRNGNLFGGLHKRGDSGSIQFLLADAESAYKEGNYSSALDFYNRILAQDPSNSVALYGAASSAIAASGFNMAAVITNIASESAAASSISGLSGLLHAAANGPTASSFNDSGSLLYGIDTTSLNLVIDLAICRLTRIVAGAADGSIRENDIDVLINLGALSIVRGALRPFREGLLDLQNINGNYEVVNQGLNTDMLCADHADLVKNVAKDLVSAYVLFNRAASLLNLKNDSLILQIRADIQTAAQKLLSTGGSNPKLLADQCYTLFGEVGISSTTFTTYDGVFSTPSGC